MGQPSLRPNVDGRERVVCCHSATLSGRYAPNSLAAVQECVEAKVPRLEVDLRFTNDDTMVAFHDRTLDRDTDGSGPVDALTRTSARQVRYRSDGSCLALFDEVVDALEGSETMLQVDLKLMRPMSPGRAEVLARALRPLGGNVIVGTQAQWNLAAVARTGLPVAFDPTLQIHFDPDRPATASGWLPRHLGVHGFWDDSPLAQIPGAAADFYLASRLDDLVNLVPGVRELMVDYRTLLAMDDLGVKAGSYLSGRGVELAAWTVRDTGEESTKLLVDRLFALGATTLITDAPAAVANATG